MADGIYEYIVRQKESGSLTAKKLLLISGYVLFPFAAFILITNLFIGSPILLPAIIMSAGIEILFIFFSWRFTRVEFESCILGSTLTITTVVAGFHRKLSLKVDIKAFHEIGLFTPEASDALDGRTLHKDYIFISSLKSDNIYYGIFSEGEEQCALYFETSPEAFKHIKRLNHSAARRAQIQQDKEKKGTQ